MKGWITIHCTNKGINYPHAGTNKRKTMTVALTILIALLGIYLDYLALKRIAAGSVNKYIKYSFVSVVALSYLPILLTPAIIYFFMDEQNAALIMKTAMVMLTTYLTLSVSRLVFYVLWLPTRKRYMLWTGVTVSSVVFLIFLYSIFITRTDYKVNEVELYYKNLPVGFDGYRLVFISDIHIGSMVDACKELSDIVGIINSTNVDAVLFGGDIINVSHSEITAPMIEMLSHLKPHDGVLMVLGNHDTGAYMKGADKAKREANMDTLQHKMQSAGWLMLRDSTVYIHRGNDSIAVTGIDYNDELLEYKHSMYAVNDVDLSHIYNNVDGSLFNITLSHLPQLWHSIRKGEFSDLTLSGHIHAMQMRIGSFSPAGCMYNEWSGLYGYNDCRLYINDGIGCVGYMARIGARPEITVIELHRKE